MKEIHALSIKKALTPEQWKQQQEPEKSNTAAQNVVVSSQDIQKVSFPPPKQNVLWHGIMNMSWAYWDSGLSTSTKILFTIILLGFCLRICDVMCIKNCMAEVA